jgi:hypothetical protein
MSRENFYRLTLGGFAISFAVVGTTFLLAPDATIHTLNRVGTLFGDFAPAPSSELRFWLTLAAAYMLLVTILAWMAQRDLRRYRHLLPILAAGKASSSLIALSFYWFSSDAFIYLLNFFVDGSITLAVLGIWATVPLLGGDRLTDEAGSSPSSPKRLGSARALHAVLETLAPAGGAFPEGASTLAIEKEVEEFIAGSGTTLAFRALLRALEYSPFVLPPIWLRRLSSLPVQDRVRVLEAWEASRLWPRRHALQMLKLAAMSHFYAHPQVQARLGYPHPLERVPTDESARVERAS